MKHLRGSTTHGVQRDSRLKMCGVTSVWPLRGNVVYSNAWAQEGDELVCRRHRLGARPARGMAGLLARVLHISNDGYVRESLRMLAVNTHLQCGKLRECDLQLSECTDDWS